MSQKKPPSHAISGVFVFLVLGIFAVFSTVMVLLGARAYKSTADRATEHNAYRIGMAYVRSMVRGNDEDQCIRVENLDGIPTISLRNVYDGDAYVTRLYVYDGMLREWFTEESEEFVPEFGESVCAMDEMNAEITGQLLKVALRAQDTWTTVDVALRSEVIE
ncbi:MAG: DUF4860 domain-containing protein [Clostridia bacterium]|nr:DUF4860 domain-containing protein [Clostridia bacterium]